MPNPINLSALVLAGGQGSRLGGIDKGLMVYHGEPVAAHLSRLLASLSNEVLISCNRNADQYQQWADRLVSDPQPDYPGPLLGILSALRVARGSRPISTSRRSQRSASPREAGSRTTVARCTPC